MNSALRALTLVTLFSLYSAGARAVATEIVIGDPAVYGSVENGFPFGTLPQYYGYPSTRYQQVYASSAFSDPFLIQDLVFYPTSNTQAPILPATFEIYLSVTDYGVNEIGAQPFDYNLGADTQLFATLVGGFTVTGPELVIHGAPFLFDPAQGNLLLDIRVNGAPLGHSGPFFAALDPGNGAGEGTIPFSRWHDFGIGFDDRGLVTGFRAYAPEPGTLLLFVLGLAGLGMVRRRSRAGDGRLDR